MKDYLNRYIPKQTKVWEFGGQYYQDEPTVAYTTGDLLLELMNERSKAHGKLPNENLYDYTADLLESPGLSIRGWIKQLGAKHGEISLDGEFIED